MTQPPSSKRFRRVFSFTPPSAAEATAVIRAREAKLNREVRSFFMGKRRVWG
jgi:hypothetical protein